MTTAENNEAKLSELTQKNTALTIENKILREENAILKNGLFGRRSERIEPGQLGIFEAEAELAVAEPPAPTDRKPKKKPGHGRAPFAPNLPRETIELDVAEIDRVCDCCGKPLQRIGEEVTERGHCVPAKIVVRRYVRPKYACPDGLAFDPLTFIERLAALVPRPRCHQLTYHGVLAPAAQLRDLVVPRGRAATSGTTPHPSIQRLPWAELLKRVFAIDALTCPWCGGSRKLIALLSDGLVVRRILQHLDLPTEPLPLAPARAPPEPAFDW